MIKFTGTAFFQSIRSIGEACKCSALPIGPVDATYLRHSLHSIHNLLTYVDDRKLLSDQVCQQMYELSPLDIERLSFLQSCSIHFLSRSIPDPMSEVDLSQKGLRNYVAILNLE